MKFIYFLIICVLLIMDVRYATDTNHWRTCHQLFIANERVADKCISNTGEN